MTLANLFRVASGVAVHGLGTAEEQRRRQDLLRQQRERARQFDILAAIRTAGLGELRRRHQRRTRAQLTPAPPPEIVLRAVGLPPFDPVPPPVVGHTAAEDLPALIANRESRS
jgi:hypothetical protein